MLYSAGRKGMFSVCRLTGWLTPWHVGEFHLGYFSFFSNKYFLIIIYIKHVPNRPLCWTSFFLFVVHPSGLSPHHSLSHVWHSLLWVSQLFSSGNRSGAGIFNRSRPILCCADHISTIPATIATTTTPPFAMQPGPIFSHSLGIDQRAGESQLAAREEEGGWFLWRQQGRRQGFFAQQAMMTRATARMVVKSHVGSDIILLYMHCFIFFFQSKLTICLFGPTSLSWSGRRFEI